MDSFRRPSTEEVAAYIAEKSYEFDAQEFIDHYESNGWMVGKTKMKSWKAACATWQRNLRKFGNGRKEDDWQGEAWGNVWKPE